MPASGSSVRSAEVPVAHHSPASEPIHCSHVPRATPITPVTTNARTARHVPIRRSATPSRRIDARTPNTSWNGSYGMNRAVTTVHHWPSSNVVMTPAAHVCSVASGAVPIAVPVTIAVTTSTTARAMLNGTRRMNPARASPVERRRPFGSTSAPSPWGATSDRSRSCSAPVNGGSSVVAPDRGTHVVHAAGRPHGAESPSLGYSTSKPLSSPPSSPLTPWSAPGTMKNVVTMPAAARHPPAAARPDRTSGRSRPR